MKKSHGIEDARGWRGRVGRTAAMGAVIAIGLLSHVDAAAQSKEDLDKARAAFREGLALSAANNCSAALVKFKAVASVKMTPQVAFNIAECEEKLGKLGSALGNYRLALDAAAGDKKAKDVATKAGPRIAAIEERIPKFTVKRGKGAEAATVELDGNELGSTQVGSEMPIDPGPHTIIGRIGQRMIFEETITIAEKENKSLEVTAKIDKDVSQAPPPPPPPPGPSVGGIVLTGLGVVLAGGGVGLFLGPRQTTIDELNKKCGGDLTCPPSAQATADKGRLFTGIAEGAIGAGAVSLVTGIILLATNGSKKAAPEKAATSVKFIGAAPGASLGGVSVVGKF